MTMDKKALNLERAIELYKKVIKYVEKGSPDWMELKVNLGYALAKYHKCTGNKEYLKSAIEAFEEVLGYLKEGSSYWVRLTTDLANLYYLLSAEENESMVSNENLPSIGKDKIINVSTRKIHILEYVHTPVDMDLRIPYSNNSKSKQEN